MAKSAKEAGLSVCPQCYQLNPATMGKHRCSRCHTVFYQRKPKSLQHTLAWTLAALFMFLPANVMPIMIFTTLGKEDSSTILSGIFTFLELGMYPVAIIVFVASFIIPLAKIIGLFILIYGVKLGRNLEPTQRTKLYHVVEFLGPWSMLDVFVVAIMAAVVNLGFITSIAAGPGINYFALMVVFTMFAAESFDPRLLWDKSE